MKNMNYLMWSSFLLALSLQMAPLPLTITRMPVCKSLIEQKKLVPLYLSLKESYYSCSSFLWSICGIWLIHVKNY